MPGVATAARIVRPARRGDEVAPLLGIEHRPEPRLRAVERPDRDDRRRCGRGRTARRPCRRAARTSLGEPRPAGVVGHDRVRHDGPHARAPRVARRSAASMSSRTKSSTTPAYSARDAERARLVRRARRASGPPALERLAADDPADRDDRHARARAPSASASRMPGHRQDRADRDDRVRRRDDDRPPRPRWPPDLGRGARGLDAPEADLVDGRLLVAPDEVVLELEPAVVGPDLGADGLVGHRQDRAARCRGRCEVAAPPRSVDRRRGAGRSAHVRREVPVAEPEPASSP